MMKNAVYQQIEKIAQERGVSLDHVAGRLGMSRGELDKIINYNMTPFAWEKIMGTIQEFSLDKGTLFVKSPFNGFCIEKTGAVTK